MSSDEETPRTPGRNCEDCDQKDALIRKLKLKIQTLKDTNSVLLASVKNQSEALKEMAAKPGRQLPAVGSAASIASAPARMVESSSVYASSASIETVSSSQSGKRPRTSPRRTPPKKKAPKAKKTQPFPTEEEIAVKEAYASTNFKWCIACTYKEAVSSRNYARHFKRSHCDKFMGTRYIIASGLLKTLPVEKRPLLEKAKYWRGVNWEFVGLARPDDYDAEVGCRKVTVAMVDPPNLSDASASSSLSPPPKPTKQYTSKATCSSSSSSSSNSSSSSSSSSDDSDVEQDAAIRQLEEDLEDDDHYLRF